MILPDTEKIVIVGAGLCGTLLAIRLAQRGYQVSLHERRTDMRKEALGGGRSINLALSKRGLLALDRVGIKEEIQEHCIPMHGRMIHGKDSSLRQSNYSGRKDDYINSVSRTGLNIALLNKADTFKNIEIQFDSYCVSTELENGTAHFKNAAGEETKVTGDVLVGTDGAGSAIRKSMMRRTPELLFNYSQDFLRSGYKELSIPPGENGSYRIEKNALHIWPRGKFMMIALPNLDGSFTVTMFHPYEGEAGFNTLNTPEKVISFFKEYYPDTLPHLPTLTEDYFNNPVGLLGTNKCYPWQAYGKTVIMGDAAHAIVPFYGQGMNASFEDVRVFDDILDQGMDSWQKVLHQFQESRKPNADAIADLAIDNFYEMQDKVADVPFIRKRKIEMQMEKQFPDYYSKYALVTFRPDLDYHTAMIQGRKQDQILLELCQDPNIEEMQLQEVYSMLKARMS